MSLARLSLPLRLLSLPLRQRRYEPVTIGHSHILYSAQVGVTDPAQRSKRNRITELKSKPQESSRPFTREDFELGAHFKFGVWESDLVLVMCV